MSGMILITGAAGKTGCAIIKALVLKGKPIRAFVHKPTQVQAMLELGADEVATGDLLDEHVLRRAMKGITAVYLICPNMCSEEVEIGRVTLRIANECGVRHFVYHSVLHPQVEAMPHHWSKMRVEELIFASQLPFTILQPTAYMQNMLAYWQQITQHGVFALPYAAHSRLSLVDLQDLADVASQVLGEPQHFGAIYELVGTPSLSQIEVAEILAVRLKRPVEAVTLNRNEWVIRARESGMSDYAVETLKLMFEYYEQHGLWGNPRVLTGLLGRQPRSFDAFIDQTIYEESKG